MYTFMYSTVAKFNSHRVLCKYHGSIQCIFGMKYGTLKRFIHRLYLLIAFVKAFIFNKSHYTTKLTTYGVNKFWHLEGMP